MDNLRYVYKTNNTVHVLNAKVSTNRKIGVGYILQTYHFSVDQILKKDLKNDSHNCLDCPFSFNQNNGKSGGCYTHKGFQFTGLISMLKKLNREFNEIKEFDKNHFDNFIAYLKGGSKIDLIRFGAYGEPVLMDLYVFSRLTELSRKTTGYTHQWQKKKYNEYSDFLMSSTHTVEENVKSKKLGFRSFFVLQSEIENYDLDNSINCLASKENEKNSSCIACGLCNGNRGGVKKNIYINKH